MLFKVCNFGKYCDESIGVFIQTPFLGRIRTNRNLLFIRDDSFEGQESRG
jgi:hypothetical protein